MKKKIAIALVGLFAVGFSAFAQSDKKGLYMFGWAQCLNDTTVYVSEVQFVAGAELDKSKQLVNRSEYSDQFKNYMELAETTPHMTACVLYGKSRSAVEKTLDKICKKLLKKQSGALKKVPANEFQFQSLTSQ